MQQVLGYTLTNSQAKVLQALVKLTNGQVGSRYTPIQISRELYGTAVPGVLFGVKYDLKALSTNLFLGGWVADPFQDARWYQITGEKALRELTAAFADDKVAV